MAVLHEREQLALAEQRIREVQPVELDLSRMIDAELLDIPVIQRAMVFEAYRQLEDKAWRSIQGSGLGLAICKGLIEAHGGSIWIGEKATPGTVVSFTLPVADSTLP